MPRVRGFTIDQKMQHQQDILVEELEVLLTRNKLTKSDIAKYLEITPQTVCYQFRAKNISLSVLMAIISLTNADAELIKRMLQIKEARA